MAGGTERHDLAAGLLYVTLAPTARARGCRSFSPDDSLRWGGAPGRCDPGRLTVKRLTDDAISAERDPALLVGVQPNSPEADHRLTEHVGGGF